MYPTSRPAAQTRSAFFYFMKESKRSHAADTLAQKRTRLETLATHLSTPHTLERAYMLPYIYSQDKILLSRTRIFRQERGFSCAMQCFSCAELSATFLHFPKFHALIEERCTCLYIYRCALFSGAGDTSVYIQRRDVP